jgi:hypothetical protein
VGIQVVQHQDHPLGVRIGDLDQIPDEVSPINGGAACGHRPRSPPTQGFTSQEEVGRPCSVVLLLLAPEGAVLGGRGRALGQGRLHLGQQLFCWSHPGTPGENAGHRAGCRPRNQVRRGCPIHLGWPRPLWATAFTGRRPRRREFPAHLGAGRAADVQSGHDRRIGPARPRRACVRLEQKARPPDRPCRRPSLADHPFQPCPLPDVQDNRMQPRSPALVLSDLPASSFHSTSLPFNRTYSALTDD